MLYLPPFWSLELTRSTSEVIFLLFFFGCQFTGPQKNESEFLGFAYIRYLEKWPKKYTPIIFCGLINGDVPWDESVQKSPYINKSKRTTISKSSEVSRSPGKKTWWFREWYCCWFRNPAPVEVGSFCHYLQGFIHPRWCRISYINSMDDLLVGIIIPKWTPFFFKSWRV